MTKTGFVIANLFHKKTRTWLTLLSVVMAFVLFGLLQSLNLVFSAGADFVGATRLVTQSRVSFTQSLPMRMVPEMDAIPGVQRVMYQQWFGAVFRENPQIFAFAVDPERLHDVYPEWVMPEEHWNAFRDTRTGMIAGKLLADRYGWKVGDRIPLKSNIFPQKNNSKDWEFELVGIFDGKDEEWRRQTGGSIYINHAYFAEATQFGGGNAGIFVLRLEDPDMAESVAMAVDKRYENSADETKTQTEKDFQVGFIKQPIIQDELHQLRIGLDQGQFFLLFQPQVALTSGRLVGAEALLRSVSHLPLALVTSSGRAEAHRKLGVAGIFIRAMFRPGCT